MPVNTVTQMDRVVAMIVETLPPGANERSIIFGSGGMLDSLGLVSFLADLEHKLSEEFDRTVVIASERAMSQIRSPFRDVSGLAAYVIDLLEQ
jgi:hypothetical protein